MAEISFNSVGRAVAFSAEGLGFDPSSGRYIISHISRYLEQHKKTVRFSLKNLQNMPKMFGLATLGDQFKMCAPSKLKSWVRA
jgi:hypothetical protein